MRRFVLPQSEGLQDHDQLMSAVSPHDTQELEVEMPQQQLPARDEIRQILIDRAFGSLAERQLLRERRTALIEYPGQS